MSCVNTDELCAPPDVCANVDDSREKHLIAHTTVETDNRLTKFLKRDTPLLICIVVLVVCMNVPYLQYVLYPFMIFSTWVHEMCHGLAAILVGGRIDSLYIYKNGSGLAYTYTSGEDWKKAFVASGGYMGTALLGGVLLLFRRTRRGPTIGLIGMGCAILLSVALYVRNTFAVVVLPIMGLVIVLCAWKLKFQFVGYLYGFLAANCSFNAVDSISELFAPGMCYVNGEARYSDAHSVAGYIGLTYWFWAAWWLGFALVMSCVGLLFAVDGQTYAEERKSNQEKFWYQASVV